IINKWDIVESTSNTDAYFEYLNKTLPFARFAPILFISALKGFNTDSIFDIGGQLYAQARVRVTTPVLNKVIEKIKSRIPSGGRIGKFLKIYYATQVGINPPEINLVVNHPELFGGVTLRYIQGQMRKLLPFREVPIMINIKGRRTNQPNII
ncbi:MAG: ribosome biogenesis GTPase Der, partial [Planctomycetota bacterium]